MSTLQKCTVVNPIALFASFPFKPEVSFPISMSFTITILPTFKIRVPLGIAPAQSNSDTKGGTVREGLLEFYNRENLINYAQLCAQIDSVSGSILHK